LSIPRKQGTIQIMDLNGNLVLTSLLYDGKVEISSTSLNKGLYLVSFTDRFGNKSIQKLVIE
jgi:hypothetical protein